MHNKFRSRVLLGIAFTSAAIIACAMAGMFGIFAATGVTDGALLRGVRFFGSGKRTHSVVMTTDSKSIRFVDTVHVEGGPDVENDAQRTFLVKCGCDYIQGFLIGKPVDADSAARDYL